MKITFKGDFTTGEIVEAEQHVKLVQFQMEVDDEEDCYYRGKLETCDIEITCLDKNILVVKKEN